MAEANMYKRGGTWWLRANVDGHEHRESLRTDDVREARKARDVRLQAIKEARFRGAERRTWSEAAVAWRAYIGDQIGAATLKRYIGSLAQCEPHLIKLAVDEVNGKALGKLVDARLAEGVTPATVKRDLTAVSSVLKYAWSRGWREGNPAVDAMGFLKERRDPIYLPTEAAFDAVLAIAPPEFRALLRAARLTGCRQAELTNMKWDQFDAAHGTLDVIGKGKKRRTIKLSRAALALFKTPGVGLIFPRDDGKPIRADWDRYMAQAMRHNPNIRRFRFHDLRHWFAVEALKGGMGIYALSQHLGHTSVVVTERSYLAFLTGEEAQQARAA